MDKIPPVAIGLPVYNGEQHLREAIESVLAQDFGDFDFLISDNCSTDATWDICNSYAEKDNRIRLNRNTTNIGLILNWQFVLDETRSRYFMWHAHDDILLPQCVGQCYAFLETHPEHVACFSETTWIDENGHELFSFLFQSCADGENPMLRLKQHFADFRNVFLIYGLLRRAILGNKGRLPITLGMDQIVATELAMAGKINRIPAVLRLYRDKTGLTGALKNHQHSSAEYSVPKPKLFYFTPNLNFRNALCYRLEQINYLNEEIKHDALAETKRVFSIKKMLSRDLNHHITSMLLSLCKSIPALYLPMKRLSMYLRQKGLRE